MSVEDIANRIMNRFKELNSKVDHDVDQKWIQFRLMPQLNPKEQDSVNTAITLLEQNGLIEIAQRAGILCLVLTQKGFDTIYDNDKEAIIQKVQKAILTQFAHNNSRVGHTLEQKWITLVYMPTLNPVEQKYVQEAVIDLAEQGYICFNKAGMLVLTEKGYNIIYS